MSPFVTGVAVGLTAASFGRQTAVYIFTGFVYLNRKLFGG